MSVVAAVVALATGVVSGCGTRSDKADKAAVTKVADMYITGALTGNGPEYCSTIGGNLKQTFRRKHLNCEREIKAYAARLKKLAPTSGAAVSAIAAIERDAKSSLKVTVSGTHATATYNIPGFPGDLLLQKIRGHWYVTGGSHL